MKILFLAKNIALDQEPIGIMLLSALLKKAGHETCALNMDRAADLRAEIERLAPDMLAYSLVSNNYREVLRRNREIKTWFKGPAVFGGPHPTFFPEMIEEEGVDVVCRGEGDEAMVELADALQAGKDIARIPNLWVKDGGEVHRNALRPLIEDLDSLPFPDREVTYRLVDRAQNGIHFAITGRGCPFDCSYCFNHLARKMAPGKYVRRRSVGNVIEELKEVKARRGSRLFSFQDDTFTMHPTWLAEFAEVYPREIGLPYACHGRADLIDEPMAEVLARSGCVMVCVGLESGNDHLRKDILDKHVSREDLLRASRVLRDYGILLLTQNLIGIPHETIDTVLETIDLNYRCRPEVMQLNLYTPHPATKLGRYACEQGLFDGKFDALPESFYEDFALDLPNKPDLLALVRLANPCLDFRHYLKAVKFASRLPRPLRRLAYAMLEKKARSLRRQGRGRDSRWRDWSYYATIRNPYQEHGQAWVDDRRSAPV
ncbi:cobalamin-dependent protein [Candidatus Sumerlaeota bacterium]|nr:cobalamin-dependent protein [Candidatus Sumerlaeota bacterium]